MVAILSAEPFNVLYKQPQFYSVSKVSTGTTLKGHGWIHGIICIMVVILSGVQMSVSS